MSTPLVISNRDARQLFLERQGLSAPPRVKLTDAGLLALIEGLGFVQVDSIKTVARAHDMILFARNQTYKPQQLVRLLEDERSLFEHWTHDAAVIPTAFYPYWRHRFAREEALLLERWRKWRRPGFEEIFAAVLDRVAGDGSTLSRDLGEKIKKSAGGWWDWHPEKTALEFHWRTGALSICRRQGFQKVYDLTANVVPEAALGETVSHIEYVDWACRSALERLGTATSGEIAAFWDHVTPKEAAAWCAAERDAGRAVEVLIETVDGSKPRKALAPASLADTLAALPEPPGRVRFLSPFDPLIRDRKRCLRLFGFDYRIEVFVPAAKRRYGYYVFPILEGARLIGRIDMKRDGEALSVINLWPEPGVRMGAGRLEAIDAELERHRRFIGAERVVLSEAADRILNP